MFDHFQQGEHFGFRLLFENLYPLFFRQFIFKKCLHLKVLVPAVKCFKAGLAVVFDTAVREINLMSQSGATNQEFVIWRGFVFFHGPKYKYCRRPRGLRKKLWVSKKISLCTVSVWGAGQCRKGLAQFLPGPAHDRQVFHSSKHRRLPCPPGRGRSS